MNIIKRLSQVKNRKVLFPIITGGVLFIYGLYHISWWGAIVSAIYGLIGGGIISLTLVVLEILVKIYAKYKQKLDYLLFIIITLVSIILAEYIYNPSPQTIFKRYFYNPIPTSVKNIQGEIEYAGFDLLVYLCFEISTEDLQTIIISQRFQQNAQIPGFKPSKDLSWWNPYSVKKRVWYHSARGQEKGIYLLIDNEKNIVYVINYKI